MTIFAKTLVVLTVLLVLFAVASAQETDRILKDFENEEMATEAGAEGEVPPDIGDIVFLEAEGFDGLAHTQQDSWAVERRIGTSRDRIVFYHGKSVGRTVERNINIPSDGKYNLWARYLMKVGYVSRFKIEITQSDSVVFSRRYYNYILDKGDFAKNLEKERGWVFDDPTSEEGIIAGSIFLWEKQKAELKQGPAVVRLITDTPGNPFIMPVIDCFIIAKSDEYRPNYKDLTNMFVRFRLVELEPEDALCSLNLHVIRKDYVRLKKAKISYEMSIIGLLNPDGEEFGKGEYTEWRNLEKSRWKGSTICTISTDFKADEEIKKAKVEIQVAWGPSEKQLIKTFYQQGEGGNFGFDLPCEMRDEDLYFSSIKSVSEYVEDHYNYIMSLNLDTADMPSKIIFTTGGTVGWMSFMCDPDLLKKELYVLRMMGVNALERGNTYSDTLLDELGFQHKFFGGGAGTPLYNPWDQSKNCPNEPDVEKKLHEKYSQSVPYYKKNGSYGNLYKFKLGDEIGVIVGDWHIENCSYCRTAFVDFLKNEHKLKPEDFGRTSFDRTRYISDKNDAEGRYSKKLYYYSKKFLSYNTTRFYSRVNKAVNDIFGYVLSYSNYSPALHYAEYVGDLDWIEMGRIGGNNIMWSEDWGYRPMAYLVDFFKSGTRYRDELVGMYLVGKSSDHHRKVLSSIAHGCKSIWFYDYQAYYCSLGDGFSENRKAVKGFAEATRIVGKADDIYYYGKIKKQKVALLYSRSGEIWRKDGAYHMEMKRIYLALLYNQIVVDIINEDDVLNDQLGQYKILFTVYANLRRDAQEKIVEWVKNGGTVIGCAGSGTRDESDAKSEILEEIFGIKHTGVENKYIAKPGWARGRSFKCDTSEYMGIIRITDETLLSPMEIESWEYKAKINAVTAKVLGTYEDGSPAITCNDIGKGKAIYFTTLLGASMWDGITACWVENLNEKQAGKFAMFDSMMTQLGVEKSVEISKFGFDATYIECETGVVVSLVNYNDTNQQSVAVKIKAPEDFKTIESAVLGKIDYKKTGDIIEVNLPVQLIDAIIIRRR